MKYLSALSGVISRFFQKHSGKEIKSELTRQPKRHVILLNKNTLIQNRKLLNRQCYERILQSNEKMTPLSGGFAEELCNAARKN
jgi:hypothetical protein